MIQRLCAFTHPAHFQHLLPAHKPNPLLAPMTTQWMAELAELEDAATEAAFNVAHQGDQVPPPVAKAPQAAQEQAVDPHPEPERYATRFIVNDGQWTPEEHDQVLREAAQGINNHYWNREAREEAERANREYARHMPDWRDRVEAAGFKAHPAVPQGPPPKGVSSMRVLPNVHEALRQHDPTSKAPSSQPSLPKKAPPTTGKGMPAGFYRGDAPPRIAGPASTTSKAYRIYSNHSSTSTSPTHLSPSSTSSRASNASDIEACPTSTSSTGSSRQTDPL